ncbi:MAG: EutN/CcmL family microcompartment protein [Lentimicrobium sp.]
MNLGRVIGNVVSTIKVEAYQSRKILVVQPIDPEGKACGRSILAIDAVQAGIGDVVLTLEEGTSARAILQEPESMTVKHVVAAIVDSVNMK